MAPWEQVLANPYVWHFAFHSIPDLPELVVQGKQREYFDFLFDVLSPEQSGVSTERATRRRTPPTMRWLPGSAGTDCCDGTPW